ncbi:MAG: glycosyltransferase [Candidatus Eisenbacteria bacterium]
MAPIRVLYCIDRIVRGGTESQVVGLINRLDRGRFAPYLCTLRPSESFLDEADCPHLELDVRRIFSTSGMARIGRLSRYLRRERIQIMQTFFQDATVVGIAAARLAGVPVRLITFRDLGFWRTLRQEFLMRRVYPMATGFLANSQAVMEHVCAHDGLSPSRVKVIYNGIDLERFRYAEHPEQEAAIGLIGNLDRPVKRADLFLHTAARVAQRHPHATWHLIGDGHLRAHYEALAADLGLGESVVFTGRIADVPGYLRKLAIGVSCSDSEGFSNAVLEYMLSGCAVIATAVGGNPELVQDGRTGLLVPAGDGEALEDALDRLLGDARARQTLAEQARAMAQRDFGWERCVADHENHYRSLLPGAGAA